MTCVHCGRGITDGRYPIHTEGCQRGLQRCCTDDTNLPYGYNAHAPGTPCENPCLGEIHPDPKVAA